MSINTSISATSQSLPTTTYTQPTHLPQSTLEPTSTVESTIIPTATQTLQLIQVGGLYVPDPRVTNPELFYTEKKLMPGYKNNYSPIVQFTNAIQLAGIETTPTEISQGIIFHEQKSKDGNQVIIGTVQINKEQIPGLLEQIQNLQTQLDQKKISKEQFDREYNDAIFFVGDYPLLIAQRNGNGDWNWGEFSISTGGKLLDLPIGTTVDVGDGDATSQKYLQTFVDNFNFYNINSMEGHWIYGSVEYWSSIAIKNNIPIRIRNIFFPLDKYPEGEKTKDGVLKTMEYRINKILPFVKELCDAGVHVEVEYTNEPFFFYRGKLYWQGEVIRQYPPYSVFGKSWISVAYVLFYNIAKDKYGLIPGQDFRIIGTNVPGIELPGVRTTAIVNEVIRIKQEIASKLGMPWEEVPFDLGIEFHLGETQDKRDTTLPFDKIDSIQKDKVRANLQKISETTKSPISITEMDGLGKETQIAKSYYYVIQAAQQSGVVKNINFFRSLAYPEKDPIWRSQLFNFPGYERNFVYYSVLKSLYDLLTRT